MSKMSKRIISIFVIFLVAVATIIPTVSLKAATPKVIISNYKLNPTEIFGGKEFKLQLSITNTSTKRVKNMKLSVSSDNGEIVPVNSAGAMYISELKEEEVMDISFDMVAAKGLEEKSYKLAIRMEYEDSNGYEYVAEDNLFIPVSLEQRVSVTDINTGDEVKLGDEASVFAQVNNVGEGMLYNVTATVEGENVEKQTTYVGNIEPGKSGSIDLLAKTKKVTDMGSLKNKLTVTYETKAGEAKTYSEEILIMVSPVDYSNIKVIKEDTSSDVPVKLILCIAVVAIAAVIILVLVIKNNKRKKKLLEEF